MILADRVRLPSPIDFDADAYKDWLHLNLFGPDGSMVLINVSVHGDPRQRSALAVMAVLVHDADGWHHTVEIRPSVAADVSDSRLSLPGIGMIELDGGNVAVRCRTTDVDIDLTATPAVDPVVAETPMPFGSGWIAWRASPHLLVEGTIDVRGSRWADTAVRAYHDHNWGRWHWGDDAGWEWAAIVDERLTCVLAAAGRRSRSRLAHRMWAWIDGRRLSFEPASVHVAWEGRATHPPVRIPGAMAALHAHRRRPALPSVIVVRADDGSASIDLRVRVEDTLQIITADPVVSGAGFIHEMVGSCDFAAVVGEVRHAGRTRMVAERVI